MKEYVPSTDNPHAMTLNHIYSRRLHMTKYLLCFVLQGSGLLIRVNVSSTRAFG